MQGRELGWGWESCLCGAQPQTMLMGLSLLALPSKASCLFKENRYSIHIKQLTEHELKSEGHKFKAGVS